MTKSAPSTEQQLELPGIPPAETMTRRNIHLPDQQYAHMQKVAQHLGCTAAELYRQGGDLILRKKLDEIRAAREKAKK